MVVVALLSAENARLPWGFHWVSWAWCARTSPKGCGGGTGNLSLSKQLDVLLYMKPFNLNWCASASVTSMQYSLFEAVLNSFAWPTNKPLLARNPHFPPRAFSTKQHHTSSQPQFYISRKISTTRWSNSSSANILCTRPCFQWWTWKSIFLVGSEDRDAVLTGSAMKVCPFSGSLKHHLTKRLQMMLWCFHLFLWCFILGRHIASKWVKWRRSTAANSGDTMQRSFAMGCCLWDFR